METKRQLKISRLLQKDLGEIFQTESRGLFHGSMITVTKVYVTNDLSLARIYLSLFGPHKKQVLFGEINKHRKEIRHHLAVRVKNQIRAIPELEFFIDDSLDYIDNIENLLKSS